MPINDGQLVVIGGSLVEDGVAVAAAPDGLMYSPTSNEWTDLDLPFDEALLNPGAVWTGQELVVAGTPCGDRFPDLDTDPLCVGKAVEVASYSPAQGTWSSTASLELVGKNGRGFPPFVTGLGWMGSHAAFQVSDEQRQYLLYEPSKDVWTPTQPVADPDNDVVCVVGGGLYAVNQGDNTIGEPAKGSRPGIITTSKYTPGSGAWEQLPDTPLPKVGQSSTNVWCANNEMIVLPAGIPGRFATPGALWFDGKAEMWDTVPEVPEASGVATPARVDGARVLWLNFPAKEFWLLEEGRASWVGAEKPVSGDVDILSQGEAVVIQQAGSTEPLLRLEPVQYVQAQAPNAVAP